MTELRKIEEVEIGPEALRGTLVLPPGAPGLILFALGSGSGRYSPRNHHVAQGVRAAGFGTLLLDLLTLEEEATRRHLEDVELLAHRLVTATHWLQREPSVPHLPIGYFGAGAGAAAAVLAAAQRGVQVEAVVSRGGRPDLAGDALPLVRAPTLLLVGSLDKVVTELNRQAYERMTGVREMVVISGAGNLFEEPGAMNQVQEHATRWFRQHLLA